MSITEGLIPFRGGNVWYRRVRPAGTERQLPLIIVHGGPGVPHDYLEPLEAFATDRQVIFYDQIGCGRSPAPSEWNTSAYTVELYIEELETVRRSLALDRVHLLGQSWGAFLCLEYVLRYQAEGHVVSMVLHSGAASAAQWAVEAARLRAQLPAEVQESLRREEEAGTTSSPAYQQAMEFFYKRHVCRTVPWPECLGRATASISLPVYMTMWGPSEFSVTGTLATWTVEGRLHEITVPCLIISGEHDEATPAISETLNRGIAHSRMAILAGCSHESHLEDWPAYRDTVTEFLLGAAPS
ncbi:putative Proline iminopeptidase [Paratrimastix pyriformis]|uniref:Proline iminopeptidase n=1 Tax=Paratrimastix pyriformis TaxID=342808 RepID=A0ABQ8UR07_9EUKA|nr:putative Proline iminopeptidase [Paratrimastix pyriformis]